MLNLMSFQSYQAYWWIIISILGAILVFLMFVQGGQTLLGELSKSQKERTLLVNSIGRKWDLTFTTLVTFGGAFFAAFPLFYATSFGGAYWVWMLILFSFVVQAVSYEYRTKANNFLGRKTFDAFLLVNGLVGTILIGTAVGTFFTGSQFSVDRMNITQLGDPVITRWETATHGLEAAINISNLALGIAVLFLARILALLYFLNNVESKKIIARIPKTLQINGIVFLFFFLLFLGLLLVSDGFSVNPDTSNIYMEPFKYFNNLMQMPLVLILFVLGVLAVIYGIYLGIFRISAKAIWIAGPGTMLVVFSLFMLAGFNNTAFYPSTYDLQSSLTIQNASSSLYTLKVMSWVSILVPFVIAYIWVTWRSMNKKKISDEDLENDTMAY